MTPAARPHCSDTARARHDPMAGTAAPARRWLLVEHPGPWATDALASRPFDPALAHRLDAAARSAGGRVLLVRRHGRRAPTGPLAWAVADHDGGVRWATWRDPGDLFEAAAALTQGAPGQAPAEPLLLVCGHGTHDVCCAVRGRPVAAALSHRWPEQTWECSHVGGDRFAANLLLVPDGLCYGGLDAGTAVDVVERHLRGLVTPGLLRGPSTEPPVVQAAVVAAHEALGPAGPRDLAGSRVEELGPAEWFVELTGRGAMPPLVSAHVARGHQPPAVLTCRSAGARPAYSYVVTDVREVTRPAVSR